MWESISGALGLDTLSEADRARASNELAARRIATESGTAIENVYQDAGGRRPIMNPEGRSLSNVIPEASAAIVTSLPRIPAAAANTGLRAIRGGDVPLTDQSLIDRGITATEAPKKWQDPNYSGISGIGESLGFSLTTLVTSALAGAGATAATGNPVVGVGAGMATSGGIAYRASKDEFLSRVRDNLNEQAKKLYGKGLDEKEWQQARQDFESAATQYGAWEAIPEALSNAIFLKAFSAPARAAKGTRLDSLTKKAAAAVAEQGTETGTALGQNPAEREAGLTNEELDLVGAFRKQFLQTLLVSGGMAAGVKGSQLAKDFYQTNVEPRVAPGSALARAIQADLDAAVTDTQQAAANEFSRPQARQQANVSDQARPEAPDWLNQVSEPVAPAEQTQQVQPAPAEPNDAGQADEPTTPEGWLAMYEDLLRTEKDPVAVEIFRAQAEKYRALIAAQAPAAPADQPQPQGAPDELRQEGQETAQAVTEPEPAGDTRRVSTVTGRQIDTRMRVVDASELQAASGELQPRDRSRAASDEQINAIASQLDPARLGESAEADRGAPIIGPDMIVESGNGRVQGIRRAYQMFPERAQAYRDFLASQGYDVTGINEPVLVRERVTELSPEDRIAFVQEANQAATMDLSPVERAKIDVSALTDGVVGDWMGGDIMDAQNRDFVRGFLGQLPQTQRNSMLDENGGLSPDGAQRIRRALLAAAYEDRDLLSKLIESTDENIKSIGNALFDVSGQWLQLRRIAREGVIDKSYDVTTDLVQAARVVDQLRQTRGKVQEWLAQTDLTGERNPIVDAFVTAFYNANITRAVGREAIGEVLRSYVEMARSQDTEGLFGAPPAPAEIVKGAVEQRNERTREPAASGSLFGNAERANAERDDGAGQGVQQGGRQARDRIVQGRGPRADGGRTANANEGTADRRRPSNQDRQGANDQAQEGVDRGANRDTERDAPADRGVQARDEAPRKAKSQRVKGAGSDIFNKASYTDRQSIYRDAFVELGYDPAEAELWPPAKQFNVLSEGLKKTYGLSVVQKSERANLRDAIDQLLDAYRGLQLMAHVMDLPTSAIGLNGELGLGLVKGAGYLGAHYPLGTGSGNTSEGIATAGQTIVMPGRSNSFAHEWGHALDFYLAAKHGDALANLSDYLREGESLSDKFPESTGDAFRHLMNAIFFDQAEQAAKIMELDQKIEQAQQKGKDTTKLEAEVEKLKSGQSKARSGRSQFYQGAGDFAQATGSDAAYWRKPTEMLARSFEAYVAHKVEAAGGTTEFITKGDYAYQSDAHIRLEKTFPKDADRFNIFRAYDLLFDAIRNDTLLNPDGKAVASFPANVRLTDPAVYFADQIRSAQSTALKRMWEEELRAWRVRGRELEKQDNRPSDPRPLMKRMGDAVRAAITTNRGLLLSMERHYEKTGNRAAAAAIRELTSRIATDPGAGRTTFAGGTFVEGVERNARIFNTRLSNISKANEADLLTDKELAELTEVLTNMDDGDKIDASEKVKKLGAQLRELTTDLYYYNRNAGLDIGFVKDQGYLPRLIDDPLVTENADEFIKDATEVYKIVFERDTQRVTDEGADVIQAMAAMEERARQAGIDLKNDPRLADYRDAKKQFNKLVRALDAIDKDDPDFDDKTDKATAELEKFLEENADIFDDAYIYVRDQWSANAAADYQTRISYGSPTDFSSHSPAGNFLKSRTLPPEADRILAKYYIQDPLERIQRYVDMSVRKSEYNRRFGRDVRNKQEKNTKLHQILERMVEAGVRREDRNMAEKIVGQITGTDRGSMPVELQRFLGNVHAIGQMTLLGRVVLTSIAEPITVAVQTGRPLDALKSVALTMQEIASTGSVRERRAMARALGIVAGDYADEMISNRLGGSYAESTAVTKASANFFRRVGLTGLTNAQRRASMQLAGRYVLDMARDATDAKVDQDKRGYAQDELRDAGITNDQMAAFGRWAEEYVDRMPRHDELIDVDGQLTEMGQAYAVMVGRLVNQSIQNPSAIDRPWAANTPIGRLVYGLLSFSMAFFRNVMVKSAKKIEREYRERGAKQAATVAGVQVLAPLATLYMGHLLVTMAREILLNPEKWEEEEKKEGGFPIKWLAQLAFSRAGFTGLADPVFNAYTGVKYQRDLSNLFVGASGSFALQAVERIAKYFAMNSENTNAAERGLARGLFELTVQPGFAYATGALPGGPVIGYGLGASYMYLTSPAFKTQWQDYLAGEKETSRKKDD
jgi:hypothetical protein